MSDKPTRLILDALSRAAAEPPDLPLFAGKSGPGLFPATAAARQAAQTCKDEGLLTLLQTDPRGKPGRDVYGVTDKGLSFLAERGDPQKVLEDFTRALEAREEQAHELIATARGILAGLDVLKTAVARLLPKFQPDAPPPPLADEQAVALLAELTRWREGGALEDCPLPELYRRIKSTHPDMSIGRFHDLLRRLHDEQRIYLHPWTAPLYDLPVPALALLVGHGVAYFASPRS